MQALSAASRYSCGLAWVLVPPISQGSSRSIEKKRGTLSPPIAKPSTWAREFVPPRQALATRQWVMPWAESVSTLSINICTASVSIPLTTLEDGNVGLVCILVLADIVLDLSCG